MSEPEDKGGLSSDQNGEGENLPPAPPDIWKLIDPTKTMGRPVKYEPDELWAKAVEYFEWAKASPLLERKAFGSGLERDLPHPKPFTKIGLAAFLGVTARTYEKYQTRADYEHVTDAINQIMFDQKFSAAAAGMMNANIIARVLPFKPGISVNQIMLSTPCYISASLRAFPI